MFRVTKTDEITSNVEGQCSRLNVCVCVCACVLSHVLLFAAPWTVAHKAPLSVEFSRQGYWNGLPFPPPGDVLDPGIKPASLLSPALAGEFFTTGATWKALFVSTNKTKIHMLKS